MSNTLLLPNAYIFNNSNLIDHIRQTYIDLEDFTDVEDIEGFLKESKNYLDKSIQIDTLIELISTIISCFKHYPDDLLPFFEDYLKNVNLNENYILLTSAIISDSVDLQLNFLNSIDYNTFVSSALNDIVPQIQNDQKIIVFGHEIPIEFKNELILNLLLSSNITEKLILDFFPYVFSFNFSKNNQKFELLLKKLNQSDLNKILPQTDDSNIDI